MSANSGSPKTRSRPNFDRVARLYRWAEYLLLGPLLARTRKHFLPQLTSATHALVLGDGDGRFLAHLLHHAPKLTPSPSTPAPPCSTSSAVVVPSPPTALRPCKPPRQTSLLASTSTKPT